MISIAMMDEEERISRLAGVRRYIPEVLLERARELRRQQTPAESILWECLRDRRLCDTKFRRQHNIGRYIADFYCHPHRLVIELDGEIHRYRQAEDAIRENWLRSQGFTVLRFANDEVFNNLSAVLEHIVLTLNPSPGGEGL